jgi:hypothetical protein
VVSSTHHYRAPPLFSCTCVRNFCFERAAPVAKDDGTIALKADEFIARRTVFDAKSVIEFVADRAKEARHRGTLSVAPCPLSVLLPRGDIRPCRMKMENRKT